MTCASSTETRAAVYVRMSTERQNYSLDHQREAIAIYAHLNSFQIVRTYTDEGKSGLAIKGRTGLQALMRDISEGSADFKAVLVYDVSRWGRFQDIDEAAYHEHTCRRAGIRVVYCAEQFQNDGSPLSAILKSIKRTMAAEYSRELSTKVFNAQCRFTELGFKQGGRAGYGLRRVSVSADGVPRRELAHGERKAAVTDRIILVLGPDFEVATIRRIYSLYVNDGMGDAAITRLLNSENIPSEIGGLWTRCQVTTILTNIRYVGSMAFNRRSCKLLTPKKRNLKKDWVITENAFAQVLATEVFEQAQDERRRRTTRWSEIELLEMLRSCHRVHGKITAIVIDADTRLPGHDVFSRFFGSLPKAYEKAGLSKIELFPFVETKQAIRAIRERLVRNVVALASESGAVVLQGETAGVLTIGSVRVRVETASCCYVNRSTQYWKVMLDAEVDFVLTARLKIGNRQILDYFLIPVGEFKLGYLYIRPSKRELFDRLQHDTLEEVFGQHQYAA